jgi:hypothetical protein
MGSALIRAATDWINGAPVTQAELAAVDRGLTQVVNGDGGGTHASGDANTTIGGAGLWLASSTAHALNGSGTLLHSVDGNPIVHADSDYTLLAVGHAGRSRVLVSPVQRAAFTRGWMSDSGACSLYSTAIGGEILVPLRVHHGATLSTATLRFAVGVSHTTPSVVPKMRIIRVAVDGTVTPLTTNTIGGFVFASRPVSPSGWYASGAVRTIALTCDVNPIDVSRYSYFAHVLDESGDGAVAGNPFFEVACAFDSIADLGPQ